LGLLAVLAALSIFVAFVVGKGAGRSAEGAVGKRPQQERSEPTGSSDLGPPQGVRVAERRVEVGPHRQLKFVDPRGADLEGVELRRPEEAALVGVTSEGGVFKFVDVSAPAQVCASKAGFIGELVNLPDGAFDKEVVLHPAEVFRGQIVDQAGSGVAEAKVLVFEVGRTPPVERLSKAEGWGHDGRREWGVVDCADDGEFLIDGLTPSSRYGLCVGAPGHILPEPIFFRAGASERASGMLVVVPYTVAALIRFSDPDGGPPISNPGLFGNGPSLKIPEGRHTSFHDERGLALAGIPQGAIGANGRDEHLVVWSSATDPNGVLTRCQVEMPGYQPLDVEVAIPRHSNPLAILDIPLGAAQNDCLGALRVRVETPSGTAVNPGRVTGPGLIAMLRSDTRQTFSFRLKPDASGEMIVDAIPCGNYAVWLNSEHRRMKTERVPVVVDSNVAADAFFDLSGYGAAELRVLQGEDREYQGQLLVLISKPRTRSHTNALLEGPPYRVEHLEPGVYELRLRLEGEKEPRDETCPLRVSAGKLSLVECDLTRSVPALGGR